MQSKLAFVHLNSTQISSQSIAGQFSFVPHSSAGYNIFFVNDNYPNACNASVHSDMVFRYSSLAWLYYAVAGVLVLLVGMLLLVALALRRVRMNSSIAKTYQGTRVSLKNDDRTVSAAVRRIRFASRTDSTPKSKIEGQVPRD